MSKRRLFALPLVFLALAACDTGGTAQVSPSAAPAATGWENAGTFAVYDGPNGSTQTISVVGFVTVGVPSVTAKVFATATVASRTVMDEPICPPGGKCPFFANPYQPPVSTSRDRIYVLDGDATVKSLAPDGSLTKVTAIPGTAKSQATFAVSPDDRQIAVGVADYRSGKFSLYVENLSGGGHVDVFGGAAPFYMPIGWHAGKVVLAYGSIGTQSNPYGASGYALIDPIAGAQPVAMGRGDCVPTGTVTSAGTACIASPGSPCLEDPVSNASGTYYYSCLRRIGWDGSETNFLLPSDSYTTAFAVENAALSPDGQTIMTDELARVHAPLSGTHGGNMLTWSASTSGQPNLRMGWISNEYFSTTQTSPDGTTNQSIVALEPPDYNGIRAVPFAGAAPTAGSLVGTLPGGL
jgi:hypothetical protein